MQVLQIVGSEMRVPLLGAVGSLQFDVVQYRLKAEYGADSRLERTGWSVMRWLDPTVARSVIEAAVLPSGAKLAEDQAGRMVALFESEWSLKYFADKNPTIRFMSTTL